MAELEQNGNQDIRTGTEQLQGVRNEDLYGGDKIPRHSKSAVPLDSSAKPFVTNPQRKPSEKELKEARKQYVDFVRNPLKYHEYERLTPEFVTPVETNVKLDSKYDPKVGFGLTADTVKDIRATSQSNWAKLGNGLVKMGVTAGTEYIEGLGYLPIALVQGLIYATDGDGNTTFKQGFWDNPLTNAMNSVKESANSYFVNYRDRDNKGRAMDFIADNLIANAGYIIGMAGAAMTPFGSAGLITKLGAKGAAAAVLGTTKSLAKAKNASRFMAGLVGSTHGAMVEAADEAVMNSKDWEKVQTAKLDEQLRNGWITKDEYNERKEYLKTERVKFGNADFLMNVPYLVMSNYLQFGRVFSAGYGTSAKFLQQIRRGGIEELKRSVPKPLMKGAANALVEGFEELNQKAFSVIADIAAEEDFNRYFRDKNNYKAQGFVNTVLNSAMKGFSDTYKDSSSWEEWAVGALLGFTGVPFMKRKMIKNPDGAVEWKLRPGMVGGIAQEFADYANDVEFTNERVRAINERLPQMEAYYRNLISKAVAADEMNAAALDKNKFEFINSEFKDMLADIELFSEIGKLNDFKELINDWGLDAKSIEDIKKASFSTVPSGDTQTIKSIFYDKNGNPYNEEEVVEKIKNKQNEILNLVDEYSKTRDELETATGELLPKEHLNHLVWMKMQGNNWIKRAEEIYEKGSVKSNIQNILNNSSSIALRNKTISESQETDASEFDTEFAFLNRLYEMSASPVEIGRLLAGNNGLYMKLRNAIQNPEQKSEFDDFIKCCRGAYNFDSKLQEYIEKPETLVETLDEEEKRIRSEWYDDIINSELGKIQNGNEEEDAFAAFYKIGSYATTPEIKDELEKKLNKKINDSDNENLKNEYKKYKDAEKRSDDFMEAYENVTGLKDEELHDIVKNFSLLFDSNDNFKKAIYNTQESKIGKETLDKIFSTMEKTEKSKVTSKVDKTPPADSTAAKASKAAKKQDNNPELNSPENSIPLDGPIPDDLKKELLDKGVIENEEDVEQLQEKIKEKVESAKPLQDGNPPSIRNNDAVSTNEINPDTEATSISTDDDANAVSNWLGSENRKYNTDELKNIHSKKENKRNQVIDALDSYGAFDFVDNGSLAELVGENDKKGLPTKVHFLIHNASKKDTPFVYGDQIKGKRMVVLAVEIENGGIEIDGKHYQIVGTLGGKLVNGSINATADRQWKVALNEYADAKLVRYDPDKKETKEWFICKKDENHNYIRKIYTGRFVKSTSEANSRGVRNIGDILMGGEKVKTLRSPSRKIGMGVVMNPFDPHLSIIGPNEENVQPLNNNNAIHLTGSVWLLTQQPDGRMYPRYCSVKTADNFYRDISGEDSLFNRDFKKLYETTDNKVYKDIYSLCEKICDTSLPMSERVNAKYDLLDYLYMGPAIRTDNGIKFENELHINGNVISSNAFSSIVIENGKDDVNKLLEKLFTKESAFRMQFDYGKLQKDGTKYVDYVIKNDILETDLLQVENVNASFDMFTEIPKNSEGEDDTGRILETAKSLSKLVITNNISERKNAPLTFMDGIYVKENGKWTDANNPDAVVEYPDEVLDFAHNPDHIDVTDSNGVSYSYIEVNGEFYPFTITSNNTVSLLKTKQGKVFTKKGYTDKISNIQKSLNTAKETEERNKTKIEYSGEELNGVFDELTGKESEKKTEQKEKKQRETKQEFYDKLAKNVKEGNEKPKKASENNVSVPKEIEEAVTVITDNTSSMRESEDVKKAKETLHNKDADMKVSDNDSLWDYLITLTPKDISNLGFENILEIRNLLVSNMKTPSSNVNKDNLSSVLHNKTRKDKLSALKSILENCK